MKQLLVMLVGMWFVFTVQAALPVSDSQGQSLPTLAPMLEIVTPEYQTW